MISPSHPDHLLALIPDPDLRDHWMAEFGRDSAAVIEYAPHFTDPQVAADWDALVIRGLTADRAAYLHGHGVTPDYPTITKAFGDASIEDVLALRTHPNGHTTPAQAVVRALLLLTHPHLTADQRTLLVRSEITLDEMDRLITTGTIDEGALALLGGLR